MHQSKSFRIRQAISTCALFVSVIAYVLIGYYTKNWTWSLFVFLLVPLAPIILGVKRLQFSFDLLIIIIYLTIGFAIGGWHPWWVLFLTIPIYHILFQAFKSKRIFYTRIEDDDIFDKDDK